MDFDLDLIFLNSPVFTSPSPSAGIVGLIGEMTTESSSSPLPKTSPNLDGRAEVDRVEVRVAVATVGDFASVPVDENGSSEITEAVRANLVEFPVVERD